MIQPLGLSTPYEVPFFAVYQEEALPSGRPSCSGGRIGLRDTNDFSPPRIAASHSLTPGFNGERREYSRLHAEYSEPGFSASACFNALRAAVFRLPPLLPFPRGQALAEPGEAGKSGDNVTTPFKRTEPDYILSRLERDGHLRLNRT